MLRWRMAGPKGLEPSTFGVTSQRSNQLSYDPIWWEGLDSNQRSTGYEPVERDHRSALRYLVTPAGIEPTFPG